MKLTDKIKMKLEEFILSKKWGAIGIMISVTWSLLVPEGHVSIFHAWIASCGLVGIGVHAQGNTDSRREASKIAYDRREITVIPPPPPPIKTQVVKTNEQETQK